MARRRILSRLAIVRALSRTPTWARVVLAVASILLGAVVFLRPTTALGALAALLGTGMVLTGFSNSSTCPTRPASRARRGSIRAADRMDRAGLFVFAWPGLTVRAVAAITGIR
jgi:uncharacterized membrane protein HdeD (DUF308 family)